MVRRLEFTPEAAAEVAAMPPPAKRALKRALERLRVDPQGTKGHSDVKRLETDKEPAFWRLAIGAWRAAYTFDRGRVRVIKVFAREDGYDWLEEP